MKISLIYPVWKDDKKVPTSLRDIGSFFAKFQIPIEVVLVFDPPYSKSVQFEIEKFATDIKQQFKMELQIHWNKKPLYRGGSVGKGLSIATGDLAIVGSIDLSTPLSETFQLVQEFLPQSETEKLNESHLAAPLIVLGQRPSQGRKKHIARSRSRIHQFVETKVAAEFKKMVPESGAQVPSTFALNKAAAQIVKDSLRSSKWYYSPQLIRAAHKHQIPWKMIDVLTIDKDVSHFSVFRWV